jgi:hypothetical protein
MYSKAQYAQLKETFWTRFGQYMSLNLSSDGEKINWVNYHTGFKGLYFRMDAGTRTASIAIEITMKDPLMRELFYDRFISLKAVLTESLQESWKWEKEFSEESGRVISRIYAEKENVNIMNEQMWPDIISFLKPRIIALDEFWATAKYAFEDLR